MQITPVKQYEMGSTNRHKDALIGDSILQVQGSLHPSIVCVYVQFVNDFKVRYSILKNDHIGIESVSWGVEEILHDILTNEALLYANYLDQKIGPQLYQG
jgi:hypothetical protein